MIVVGAAVKSGSGGSLIGVAVLARDKIIIDDTQIDGILLRCDTVDQLFKTIENVIDQVGEHEKECGRPQFVVVIVDTIAGTASKEEISAEWGKDDYSRQPKQLRQAFRKIQRKLNRLNVCMICTNQVSDNFSKSTYGAKSSTPRAADFSTFGGKALKFYSSLRVFMFGLQNKWTLRKGNKFQDGFLVGFCTTKNRQLKPMREGRAVIIFDKGFDNLMSILETLLYLDFAVEDPATRSISFRFDFHGVTPTTFGESSQPSIDSNPLAAKVRKRKNPTVECRADWPKYYAAHKADFDALFDKACTYALSVDGHTGASEGIAADEDEDSDSADDSVFED